MKRNIIELSDSYKFTHWNMMPDDTEFAFSYFESRNGAQYDETVFFSLQAILMENLVGKVVTQEKIDEAAALSLAHFGDESYFNRKGWEHILNEYNGHLPVRIKAIPEGTPVSVSNVLMTVENLGGAKTRWLTNYLETILSQVWYGSTVATISYEAKKAFKHFLSQTSENANGINFMLHDFGFRGVSSVESAAIGGMGHLVNFLGTDTVIAMRAAVEYYGAPINGLAYSVAATEHSIMTPYGPAGESKIIEDIIKKYPKGILSVVFDSFGYKNCLRNIIGTTFRDAILARDGIFVCRPDSGNPEEVTLETLDILGEKFGFTMNSKGYRVLNPKVRVLWGDGIDLQGIKGILGIMMVYGWSAENMVFGMGGGLLQKVNRDTQRFAFKSSAQCRSGVWHDVYKNPTDITKKSKRGRLSLVKIDGKFTTVSEVKNGDLLKVVFENGVLVNPITFDEVRKNALLT